MCVCVCAYTYKDASQEDRTFLLYNCNFDRGFAKSNDDTDGYGDADADAGNMYA